MVEVMRQRPMSILHPYTVEVYVAKDGSEACLSLNPPKAFCAQNGAVKEVRLELEFKQYEVYEEKIERGAPPQGTIGVYRGGQGVRKDALTAFLLHFFTSKISVLNWIYLATADPLKPFIAIRR
jgi:hypothetical protein